MMLDLISTILQIPEAKLTALVLTGFALFNFYALMVLGFNLFIYNPTLSISNDILSYLFKNNKLLLAGYAVTIPGLTIILCLKYIYFKVKS